MVNKIVITGGPGSGKTTLINQLFKKGYKVSEEVSRKIIREQSSLPNGVLPWTNLKRFAALALKDMTDEWHRYAHQENLIVFYDRGIPDIIAYLNYQAIACPVNLQFSIHNLRYFPTVFWCGPWPDIYKNDPERPQTFQEAQALGIEIKNVYESFNYNVVELPQKSIDERADFIIDMLDTFK